MVRFGSTLLAFALLSGMWGLSAAGVEAATCTFDKVRIEVTPVTSNLACANGVSGTYVEGADDRVGHDFFGTRYTLSYKSDEAQGDGAVEILDGLEDEAASDAIWKIGNFAEFGSVLLGVKQSGGYAVFELAAGEGGWGIFKTGKSGARTNDYSHWALWYAEAERVAPVPLPASLVLLLLGAGSFGVAAARRRSSR